MKEVARRIEQAATRAGRDPKSVLLLAISKTQPAERIRAAYAEGLRSFGENYAQELVAKQTALADLDIDWHFVGRLQTNKAKDVTGRVRLLHSVDRIALAMAVDKRSRERGVVQEVLFEVHLGGEATKGGMRPDEVGAMLDALAPLGAVRCVGLMTMPPPSSDSEQSRPYFRELAALAAKHSLPELSMGMSNDFEVAIEEGATIIRIGTALFGPRLLP